MRVFGRVLRAAAVVMVLSWAYAWAGQAPPRQGQAQTEKARSRGTETRSATVTGKVLLAARAEYVGDLVVCEMPCGERGELSPDGALLDLAAGR